MTIQQVEKIIQIAAAIAAIVSASIMLTQVLNVQARSEIAEIQPCVETPP